MDAITLEGYGVFISALIVFCGSIWLLLSVVLGSRLAYFITASVTLAFVLIMGAVWSFTQLGPVGVAPSWTALGVGEDPTEIDFSGASSYPDGDWRPPGAENEEDVTHASESEGAASEALTAAIDDDEITTFAPEGDERKPSTPSRPPTRPGCSNRTTSSTAPRSSRPVLPRTLRLLSRLRSATRERCWS